MKRTNLAQDEEYYIQLINSKSEVNSKELLPCAGISHFNIVVNKLLEKTEVSIQMVVGNNNAFNYEFYEKLSHLIIKQEIFLRIIFIEPEIDNKFYKFITTNFNESFGVTHCNASNIFKNKLRKYEREENFLVFDDDKFLYKMDSENYKAYFSYNDVEHTNILSQVVTKNFIHV